MERCKQAEDLLFQLARHLRNSEKQRQDLWFLKSMELLTKVREFDPKKYEELVKP